MFAFPCRFWFSGFGSVDKFAVILPILAVFRVFLVKKAKKIVFK
jgi:uncharacterized membrane protein